MNDLTSKEQIILARNERVIETGLFYFFEVGSALLTIRDSKLYRATYATFEAYCSDMWGMSKPRAYQLIDAAKVKDNLLSTSVDLPATESQTRPLYSLPPDQQASAWQKAVETAPDGKVTAAHVQKVVREMRVRAPTPEPKKPVITDEQLIHHEPVGDSFKTAFDQMCQEIKYARAMNWKETSHKGALEMMQMLTTMTGKMES